jgi:hypothetical protein
MATRLIDGTIVHDDANEARITELFVFLSTDETGDGICATDVNSVLMSLVTSKPRIAETMKPIAEKLAKLSGKPIKLVRFERREDIWP